MNRGIDVSHHNGLVDWARVARAGITFAYIKATQGAGFGDPMFGRNLRGAAAAGIQHGVYHYLTPGDQASDQAANFLHAISDRVGGLAPAIDIEPTFEFAGGPDLWAAIPLEERIEKILKFGDAVEAATGVLPILYASPSYIEEMLGSAASLASMGLWVSEYEVSAPRIPRPFTSYVCWQYSESGSVDGAGAGVDLDLWNG